MIGKAAEGVVVPTVGPGKGVLVDGVEIEMVKKPDVALVGS